MPNDMKAQWCTLWANLYSVVADRVEDSDDIPDLLPLSGRITLTPQIQTNSLIPELGARVSLDRSYAVAPIAVNIVAGKIAHNGTDHIKLLASTPGLDGTLQWRVGGTQLTDTSGNRYQIESFNFNPIPGGEVSLSRVSPVPAEDTKAITRGLPGDTLDNVTVDGSNLVVTVRTGEGVVKELTRIPIDQVVTAEAQAAARLAAEDMKPNLADALNAKQSAETAAQNAKSSENIAGEAAATASGSLAAIQDQATKASDAADRTAQSVDSIKATAAKFGNMDGVEAARASAESSAKTAQDSATSATSSRDTATQVAQQATTSQTAAAQSEKNAASSEANAAASASAAKSSQDAAASSETNAKSSADTATQQAAIATSAAGQVKQYTGSGSPQGKLYAPRGAIYVDTDATTGAVSWTKTNTSGGSGWAVLYGDTGKVNLTPQNFNASAAWCRRVGNLVQMQIIGTATATGSIQITSLPKGFSPGNSVSLPYVMNGTVQNASISFDGSNVSLKNATANFFNLTASYLTFDEWPSTLPS